MSDEVKRQIDHLNHIMTLIRSHNTNGVVLLSNRKDSVRIDDTRMKPRLDFLTKYFIFTEQPVFEPKIHSKKGTCPPTMLEIEYLRTAIVESDFLKFLEDIASRGGMIWVCYFILKYVLMELKCGVNYRGLKYQSGLFEKVMGRGFYSVEQPSYWDFMPGGSGGDRSKDIFAKLSNFQRLTSSDSPALTFEIFKKMIDDTKPTGANIRAKIAACKTNKNIRRGRHIQAIAQQKKDFAALWRHICELEDKSLSALATASGVIPRLIQTRIGTYILNGLTTADQECVLRTFLHKSRHRKLNKAAAKWADIAKYCLKQNPNATWHNIIEFCADNGKKRVTPGYIGAKFKEYAINATVTPDELTAIKTILDNSREGWCDRKEPPRCDPITPHEDRNVKRARTMGNIKFDKIWGIVERLQSEDKPVSMTNLKELSGMAITQIRRILILHSPSDIECQTQVKSITKMTGSYRTTSRNAGLVYLKAADVSLSTNPKATSAMLAIQMGLKHSNLLWQLRYYAIDTDLFTGDERLSAIQILKNDKQHCL
jgi:hypothetical protein